jgi:hypothetical protein
LLRGYWYQKVPVSDNLKAKPLWKPEIFYESAGWLTGTYMNEESFVKSPMYCCWSGFALILAACIRIQVGKMTHKKKNKVKKCFILKSWMFSLGGWSLLLYTLLDIPHCKFWSNKYDFLLLNNFTTFVNLSRDPYSSWPKMLDPDPYWSSQFSFILLQLICEIVNFMFHGGRGGDRYFHFLRLGYGQIYI